MGFHSSAGKHSSRDSDRLLGEAGPHDGSEPNPFEAVPPEELAFALSLFVGAANKQIAPPLSPCDDADLQARADCEQLFTSLSRSNFHRPEQEVLSSEGLLARAFVTVWDNYRRHDCQSAVCARVLGFYYLMERSRGSAVKEWAQPCIEDPGLVVLDSAVIEGLASIPFGADGFLHEDRFLAHTEMIAKGYVSECPA